MRDWEVRNARLARKPVDQPGKQTLQRAVDEPISRAELDRRNRGRPIAQPYYSNHMERRAGHAQETGEQNFEKALADALVEDHDHDHDDTQDHSDGLEDERGDEHVEAEDNMDDSNQSHQFRPILPVDRNMQRRLIREAWEAKPERSSHDNRRYSSRRLENGDFL